MPDMRWRVAQRHFQLILLATVLINLLFIYQSHLFLQTHGPPAHVPTRRFITAHCLDGRRLGNMMFNYASLLGIAARYNMTPLMHNSFALFHTFHLTVQQTSNVENSLGIYQNYEEYGKRACAYDIHTEHFEIPTWNKKLHGYFQSWRYFEHISEKIRAEFTFEESVVTEARLVHAEAVRRVGFAPRRRVVRVGVHVRRGDVLDEREANYGYNTPGALWYSKAMTHMRTLIPGANLLFIVCSDDMAWAREHVQGAHVHHSQGHAPATDLAVLALCDHVIMSVGSFGWWAAWLANGTTLYYGDWPRPVSQLEYMVTKRDYFPPYWTPVYDKD